MSLSRRRFIVGTAAGLILPSYYEKVLSLWENFGEVLIEAPPDPEIELIAVDWGGDGYELNWGDPHREPPEMTIREFARRYWGGEADFAEQFYGVPDEEIEFDELMESDWVFDAWSRQDSSNARAYRLLEKLDLGPDFKGEDAVGEIRFIDGPHPGSDYLGVEAANQVSISLLQRRLTDLGTNIRISLG